MLLYVNCLQPLICQAFYTALCASVKLLSVLCVLHIAINHAPRYFDKTGTGYLRVEDLRRIIHNLGAGLCHRSVKALVHSVADPQGGWRGERVYYRSVHAVLSPHICEPRCLYS